MTWISYTDTMDEPRLICLGPGDVIGIGGHGDDRTIEAGMLLVTGLTLDEAKSTMEALTLLLAHNTSGVISMAAAIRRKSPTQIHDTTVDGAVATANAIVDTIYRCPACNMDLDAFPPCEHPDPRD